MDSWRLMFLGSSGVGKTALAVQFISNSFSDIYTPTIEDDYIPTIEGDYRTKLVVDNRMCFVELLDTSGIKEYAALRGRWVHESQGLILTYSITSRTSFEDLEEFYQLMRRVKGGDPIFILVANKCDMTAHQREVSKREGATLARQYGCEYIETSAKTPQNIERVFRNLVRSLRQTSDTKEEPRQPAKKTRKPSKCVIM